VNESLALSYRPRCQREHPDCQQGVVGFGVDKENSPTV